MAIEDDECSAFLEARRLDGGNPAAVGQADVFGDVGPLLAAVSSHPQIAIVGSDVQHIGILRRLGQGAGAAALRGRDVRRDDAQIVAAIQRAEHDVAGSVIDARIAVRQDERRVPVEPIAPAARIANRLRLTGVQVPATQSAVLGRGIHQIGIGGIDTAGETIRAADTNPVLVDGAGQTVRLAWPAPTAVVLQAAVDAIGPPGVHGHVIKLADGHLIELVPGGRAVVGNVGSPVVAQDHVPAIARIDPQRVMIAMYAAAAVGIERLAAVVGAVQRKAQNVEITIVIGIDADLTEVHGPGIEAVEAHPRFALVARLVDAAVLEAVGLLLVLNIGLWLPRRSRKGCAPLSPAGEGFCGEGLLRPARVTSTSFVSCPRCRCSLTLSPLLCWGISSSRSEYDSIALSLNP